MLSINAVKKNFNQYKHTEGCLGLFSMGHSLEYKRLKKFLKILPDSDNIMDKHQFFQFFDVALTVNVCKSKNESENKLFFALQDEFSDKQKQGIYLFLGIKEREEKNKSVYRHYNTNTVYALMLSDDPFHFVLGGLENLDALDTVFSELFKDENLNVDKQPIKDAFQYLLNNPSCDFEKLLSDTQAKMKVKIDADNEQTQRSGNSL